MTCCCSSRKLFECENEEKKNPALNKIAIKWEKKKKKIDEFSINCKTMYNFICSIFLSLFHQIEGSQSSITQENKKFRSVLLLFLFCYCEHVFFERKFSHQIHTLLARQCKTFFLFIIFWSHFVHQQQCIQQKRKRESKTFSLNDSF